MTRHKTPRLHRGNNGHRGISRVGGLGDGASYDDMAGSEAERFLPGNEYIEHVQAIFNERPRKVLNWRSPAEVFNQLLHL